MSKYTFSKEFLSSLIDSINLSELISNDLNIKLKGYDGKYWLCCPFHGEKTPSFSIKNNTFLCFGCSASGNAIKWLRKWRNLSFSEAVIELSNMSGIPLPEAEDTYQNDKTNSSITILDVLRDNNYFYTYKIKNDEKALNFLINEKGYTLDIINKYNLGLVTCGISLLLKKKYSEDLLIESGLFNKNFKGILKDILKYRITIPIFNERGNIISFSGRKLPSMINCSNNYPKYINGRETALFQKKEILYGLNFSKKFIIEKNAVFVVEGYFDHITLSQHNVGNSVATMGTSVNDFQLNKIFTLANNIIFCFDGDLAGTRAALKVAYMCLNILSDDKKVSFILLPDNHDPDSFIRSNGIDCWNEEVKRKIPLSLLIINDLIASNVHDSSVESNVNIAVKAKKVINSINPDAILYKQALKLEIENRINLKI